MSTRPVMSSRTSSGPSPTVPRMILAPLVRLTKILHLPTHLLTPLLLHVTAALQRLDLSRDPTKTIQKMKNHKFTVSNVIPLVGMALASIYSLYMMNSILKYFIVLTWATACMLPITGQFVWPASPIFAWLVTFFCARYIPADSRPKIHVNLLPALESVMYGANISDLQTRFTHPVLDVLAWVPYGVLHFVIPFVIAAVLWVFGPKGSIQYWGRAFGLMNLLGVVTQILLPCSAPWYEIIHGLTPANYQMPGSPGGLLRIDRVFGTHGYANAFGSAPLVFGAFPSLHSGSAVMEALFLSHFFPSLKPLYWAYTGVLWWATMYLSHHYLIDLTGGACLSVMVFYLFMPEEFKDSDQIVGRDEYVFVAGDETDRSRRGGGVDVEAERKRREREEMDLDEEIRKLEDGDGDLGEMDEEQAAGGEGSGSGGGSGEERVRSKRSVSWGETKVMGEQ